MRYKGTYHIKWLDKGLLEVYIKDRPGDIPCFERFVCVWDAKTDEYIGFCGEHWFRENIVLDLSDDHLAPEQGD